LSEDIPSLDYGAFVVGSEVQEATLLCKAKGVVAGVPFFNRIFERLGCSVDWRCQEGQELDPADGAVVAAVVKGPVCRLLQGERTALNLLARASGIATRARLVRKVADEAGYKGLIAATRKTTPGFRLVEKYAVKVGGCDGHRHDLSSMIMLKDNHIWATQGQIKAAIAKARSVGGFSLKIEVECRNEKEAMEAIEGGADVVMLDNFAPDKLHQVASNLKNHFSSPQPTNSLVHSFLIEASGGVTCENLAQYCGPFIDVISMGLLTQSVPHIDFSLKIKH